MCQLTLANLQDPEKNGLYLTLQMYQNSSVSNKDGCGYSSGRKYRKFGRAAFDIPNLGCVIKYIATENPTMGHVRLATAVNGIKTISEDHSHPFVGERFILYHNGSLFSEKEFYKKSDKAVDSDIFLGRLEEVAGKDGDFVKSLQDTMKEFHGKFAFMIYDKLTNHNYVVRGKTATLFISKLYEYNELKEGKRIGEKLIGYVINTERHSLDVTLSIFRTINGILWNKDFQYETELLKEETIYLVNGLDLLEVGIIKENIPEVAPVYNRGWGNWTDDGYPLPQRGITHVTSGNDEEQLIERIENIVDVVGEFLNNFGLSLSELDYLLVLMCGDSLLTIDFESLLKNLRTLAFTLKPFNERNKMRMFRNLANEYRSPELNTYIETGLQFPFQLNDSSVISAKLREAEQRNEAATAKAIL